MAHSTPASNELIAGSMGSSRVSATHFCKSWSQRGLRCEKRMEQLGEVEAWCRKLFESSDPNERAAADRVRANVQIC